MRKERGVFEKIPGSNEWWCRWTDGNGQLHREKVGKKKDAAALYAKRKTEVLQRKKLPEKFRNKVTTFETLCEDALKHCKSENTAKSHYELQLKVNELLPVFGGREAASITKQELVDWLDDETAERDWKPSSRNRWQAALSLIFRVGVDNEKIENNPAARIRRKFEDNHRVRFLTNPEELAIKRQIGEQRLIDAFDISIHTGMRQLEQFSLKWDQVDINRRIVQLGKTKTGKPRFIPLNGTALAAFKRLLEARQGKQSFVFPGRNGEAVDGARGWFKAAVDRSGVEDYTWHCNRHTFASRLVQVGVDLMLVGKLLGHTTAQMTLRYAHLAPSQITMAVERLTLPMPVAAAEPKDKDLHTILDRIASAGTDTKTSTKGTTYRLVGNVTH